MCDIKHILSDCVVGSWGKSVMTDGIWNEFSSWNIENMCEQYAQKLLINVA